MKALKLSPMLLLAIIAAVIFAVGLGLAGLVKAPESIDEQPSDTVPDGTGEQPEFSPPVGACGNSVCDVGERCNEETSRTACTDDCGFSCPAKLLISSQPNPTETQLSTYYCGSGACRQTDDNDFIITGDATIRTRVTNIGERGSDRVSSDFACDLISNMTSLKANNDGEDVIGVVIRDYFTDNQETVSSIKSRQAGNNFAEYMLEMNFTETAQTGQLACLISIRSTGLLNQQTLVVSIAPTA